MVQIFERLFPSSVNIVPRYILVVINFAFGIIFTNSHAMTRNRIESLVPYCAATAYVFMLNTCLYVDNTILNKMLTLFWVKTFNSYIVHVRAVYLTPSAIQTITQLAFISRAVQITKPYSSSTIFCSLRDFSTAEKYINFAMLYKKRITYHILRYHCKSELLVYWYCLSFFNTWPQIVSKNIKSPKCQHTDLVHVCCCGRIYIRVKGRLIIKVSKCLPAFLIMSVFTAHNQ